MRFGCMVAVVQANADDLAGIGNDGLECNRLACMHSCSRYLLQGIDSKCIGVLTSSKKIKHVGWQARLGAVQINDHLLTILHLQRTERSPPILKKGDKAHGDTSFPFTRN